MLLTGRKCAAAIQPIAPLVTRLCFGNAFFVSGWGHWHNFDKTRDFFTTWGLPLPTFSAGLTTIVELVGGACVVLGLATRLSAAMLSTTMVVALLTADRPKFVENLHWLGDLTDVTPFVFLAAMLWLVGYGAGPVSVDHRIARNLSKEGS